MKPSDVVQTILFDYETLSAEQIVELCHDVPRKIIRWLGANHPDNRTRKLFFRLTNIEIGEGTVINQNLVVSDNYQPLLKIGKRVAMAPNITVICVSEPNNSVLQNYPYVKEKLMCEKPVIIEDDVWIGTNVTILPGVTIGACAVVGAGSVVSRSVPPATIVAGVPARVIRHLSAFESMQETR